VLLFADMSSKLMGVESNTIVCGVDVVLKLLKNGSPPKSGTSNVMSISVSLVGSLLMEKEVSGKADAKDASNAGNIIGCCEGREEHT